MPGIMRYFTAHSNIKLYAIFCKSDFLHLYLRKFGKGDIFSVDAWHHEKLFIEFVEADNFPSVEGRIDETGT